MEANMAGLSGSDDAVVRGGRENLNSPISGFPA